MRGRLSHGVRAWASRSLTISGPVRPVHSRAAFAMVSSACQAPQVRVKDRHGIDLRSCMREALRLERSGVATRCDLFEQLPRLNVVTLLLSQTRPMRRSP